MEAIQISYRSLSNHRDGKRLYIQGLKLGTAGYSVGSSYQITEVPETNSLILKSTETGDRKVSRKKVGVKIYPLIDLSSKRLMQFLGAEITRVCVVISYGFIKISLHPVDQSIKDRINTLYRKLSAGNPLAMGSLCHGGGVLDNALHLGLQAEGVPSHLAWLIEMNEAYIQASINNNSVVGSGTLIVNGTLEEIQAEYLSCVDILVAGLPCTGASRAGKSKNKIKDAEEHALSGTAFLAFLEIIKQTKPAAIILENVLEYQKSLSFLLITERLSQWGYDIHTMTVDRSLGAFEDRNRLCMVAVTRGIPFNCNLLPSRDPELHLGEMLVDIKPDSPLWKECEYLDKKAARDLIAGKGFKTQLVTADCEKIGVIGRGYAKYRSTEPMLQHPSEPKKRRLLTPIEHARVKSIPESLVDGVSATIAHEILGQSVLHSAFVSVGMLIGAHLNKHTPQEV